MRQLTTGLAIGLALCALRFAAPVSAAVDYAGLKTELQTNPQSIAGLAAAVSAGQDQVAADLLNTVRAGAPYSITLPSIASTDVQAALDPTEFATLSATQLSQLSVMLSGGTLNSSSQNVRSIIVGIFSPAGSFPNTRAALQAAVKRQGSRAEVLFGAGTVLTHQDVRKALNQ